jgi:hypothetical protein
VELSGRHLGYDGMNKRGDIRVSVQFRSHFSAKGREGSGGNGEVRDLSPGGCRIMSPIEVPQGADLELCMMKPTPALSMLQWFVGCEPGGSVSLLLKFAFG